MAHRHAERIRRGERTPSRAVLLLVTATVLLLAGVIPLRPDAPAALGPHATVAARQPVLGIAAGGTLQFAPPAQRNAYLAAAHDLGASWLRFDFTWNDIQRADAGHDDWARYDALVAAARKNGLHVLGMIGYAPAWARLPSCAGDPMCRPASASAYGTFAGQVARRYGPRGVHHWEIWNEPNTAGFFKPAADPGAYTHLLAAADRAIHAADPKAEVLTGGTAPASTGGGNYSPTDFLTGMFAAGAQGHFDILGHHPYCFAGSFDCPDTTAKWSAWSQMSATPVSLRSLLADHGDRSTQIWATEFGAPTAGGSTAVTEQHQSTMLADALRTFSGYSWAGPLFVYSLQDLGTNPADGQDWFGVLRADGSRKPAFDRLAAMLRQVRGVPPTSPGAVADSAADKATGRRPDGASAGTGPAVSGGTLSPLTPPPALSTATVPVTGSRPVLLALSPARGPVAGGTEVLLRGINLGAGGLVVRFGDRVASPVRVVDSTAVRVAAPTSAGPGPVNVTVSRAGHVSALVAAYDYRHRPSWFQRAIGAL